MTQATARKPAHRPLKNGDRRRNGDEMKAVGSTKWVPVPESELGTKITRASLRTARYRRPQPDDEQKRIEFGERVRWHRLKKDLSQKDLALKVGLTPAAMNNIETGVSWGSMPVYGRICEALGIVPALMK